MKNQKFIEECKKRAYQNRFGKLQIDDLSPITNQDHLKSFYIQSGCFVDGSIIGSVYVSCLTAEFTENKKDLVGKTVQAHVGVGYENGETEYIDLGSYQIERPKNAITENHSQIIGYSNFYQNLDQPYQCGIDYSKSVTVKDLYLDVCNQLNVTPTTTSFLNSTIPILKNPFQARETNRTVLEAIGKASCSFVVIDPITNEIDLCWVSQKEEVDYTFYKNDYVQVEGGEITCGPINCLILKHSQIDDENVTAKEEESIQTYGEHTLTISEDYILYNASLREQAIEAIWNRVKGFQYVDCKLTTYYGKPFLKLGDKIRIYTSETEYFDTFILKHTFTYDGCFTSNIESPALTSEESKTKQDIGLKEALKNTQIIVDKQNQKIESMVEEVHTSFDEVTEEFNSKIEMTSKQIQSVVKEIQNQENKMNIVTQTIHETTNQISETGGSNLLLNTRFYQDAEEWEKENGSFNVLLDYPEFLSKTESKVALKWKAGKIYQPFQTIIGQSYTLSFKYKKDGVNQHKSSVYFLVGSKKIDVFSTTSKVDTITEFSYSYVATTTNPVLCIETEEDNFYVSDLIIQVGSSKIWSPNRSEVRGLGHKLTKNELELYDISSSNESVKMTPNSLKYDQGGNTITEYSKNKMNTPYAEIGQGKLGNLTITKVNNDITLFS